MMNDQTLIIVLLVTGLPFVAFGVILLGTRACPRLSAGVSLTAAGIAMLGAGYLLGTHWQMTQPVIFSSRWMTSGSLEIVLGVLLDPLSLLMLLLVTAISFLVQFYSLGYMAGDPGLARYYAYLSLFAWAMTNLTLAPNLLQLYIFWELVGLSSYLLIGFWSEKFSASEAGKKAFVMTRLGDVAFFIGILVLLLALGNLDILALNDPPVADKLPPAGLTWAALLIFGGIIGKSAQFPLLTWLPDAMEGPTPVSALLHSATMVAAGVYLFARLFPFFSLSSTAMTVMLAIGTLSMLLAATMAMVTRDIKQVWAYSTISQLGFMIMGLAAGGYFAGVFHLVTHAGFKALLFLCAGVFIHHFGTNDMFVIGRRAGRRQRVPMLCLVVAAGALAGLPPLSGFFSKELILGRLADLDSPLWLAAGLLGALLTAYYAFRLIFVILSPRPPEEEEEMDAGDQRSAHAHHSAGGTAAMVVPLLILTAVTIALGFYQNQLDIFLAASLTRAMMPAGHHDWLFYSAVGAAVAGVALAWMAFGRPGASQKGVVARFAGLNRLFAQRWYLDHLYRWLLDHLVYGLFAKVCLQNDRKVIDAGLDGLAQGTVGAGRVMSGIHKDAIQPKLLVMFVVMLLLALYFIF